MKTKYTFLLISFLLIPLTIATDIQVLYFYSSTCPISRQIDPYKNSVKNYWEDKVNWTDYDFMIEDNREVFTKHRMTNVPVALVNCFNKTYRIERDEIREKLDRSIAECYGLEEKFPKRLYILLGIAFIFFLIALKKPREKIKRRVKRKYKS